MRVESLYPFTQAMLWVGWKIFGVSPLPWHLLFVSLHALCAWGWMRFYSRIFGDKTIGFFAGAFLLLSPYATEVVVWKAGYHYLQGMLFLLLTLFALLRYLDTGKRRWIALGLCAFLPSLFALEAFYLTPVCVAVLLLHNQKNPLAKKAFRTFLLPLLLLCVAQYFIYRSFYSRAVPHVGALHWEWIMDYLRKPAKYIFHLFFFGRYWPQNVRVNVYEALNSWALLITFYCSLLTLLVKGRAALKAWISQPLFVPAAFGIAALLLVIPMHFHEEGLVYFDRYAYFMLPAVGAVLSHFVKGKIARAAVLLLSASLLFHTILLWRKSDALSRKMLSTIPDFKDGKPTLLLNLPNALQSIPMIGQTREGEAALMRRYVLQKPLSGVVLEPSACNLFSGTETVKVVWEKDSVLRVTQPTGGGWWTGGVLSADWENVWFAVHFLLERRSYVLRLKAPLSRYHLLFWKENHWLEIQHLRS